MANILLIEDSIEAQILIQKSLPDHAIEATKFYQEAVKLLETKQYDLILLDLNLPDGNGYDICQQLKEGTNIPRIPIIMITGQSGVEDRIKGLNSGADDYIAKPFSPLELKARIESVLRRGPTRTDQNQLVFGNLTLKIQEQKAYIHADSKQKQIDLTPVEFKILLKLSQSQNTVPRKDLMHFVWGKDFHISPRNVDTHVCKLRKKIEDASLTIKNKRGQGYFLAQTNVPKPVTSFERELPHSL